MKKFSLVVRIVSTDGESATGLIGCVEAPSWLAACHAVRMDLFENPRIAYAEVIRHVLTPVAAGEGGVT